MAETQTITADRLCALTGLKDDRHRQLAKQGYFPAPKKGLYQLTVTLQGLFRYYREREEAKAVGKIGPDAPKIVESHQAAASILGYAMDAIKTAKSMGCPAFKPGNRIDLFELEEWFARHPEIQTHVDADVTVDQAERIERVAKALERREKYRKFRRELIAIDEVRRDFTRAYLTARSKFLAMSSALAQKLVQLHSNDPVVVDGEIKARVIDALNTLEKEPWLQAKCEKCGSDL